MVKSMTGFAARTGEGSGFAWSWEVRSVNGKGLDLRLRLPDGIDGLEQTVRAEVAKRFARGNIVVSLRLERAGMGGGPAVDPIGLERALAHIQAVEAEAAKAGLELRPSSATDILSLKGVIETAAAETDAASLKTGVINDLAPLLDALAEMRAREGVALNEILTTHITRLSELSGEAEAVAKDRAAAQAEALKAALARVMENTDGLDPTRLTQEIAIIAVKTDVTEELDRLNAHISAAKALLEEDAPIGRRFDFLAQEFNREANTLASKSNHADLTRVALALKAAIDQMREQVQNVE